MMENLTVRDKQKRQSRAKILKAAITLFGKQGPQATGIDQIMHKAGLTAGAFYAHFTSKNQLVEEVLFSALNIHHRVRAEDFVDIYLSPEHRDHPERSCPLATLGSDLARADRGLRKRIADRLETALEERLRSSDTTVKDRALAELSLAVGALILSRITKGTDLSDAFLTCHRHGASLKLKT